MATEMQKIQKALADLSDEIGTFARASVSIHTDRISACAYFSMKNGNSYIGEDFHSMGGETPLEAISALRAEWLKQKDSREAELLKTSALAIIRITHEQGECTDAALRCETGHLLTEDTIGRAIKLANAMADEGPFKVVRMRGANAA